MSLAVSIGQLAFLRRYEPEEVESFRRELCAGNRGLESNGWPRHSEPEALPEFQDRASIGSIPYGWLQHVRRAVAYAMRPGKRFQPLREGEDPSADELYDKVLCSCESHIICHSDCEG